MKKIIILASGNGSNFESICKKIDKNVKIECLITNNPMAQVIKKAKKYQIKTHIIDSKSINKNEYKELLIKTLEKYSSIDLIVLAGYMKIIEKEIIEKYKNKIINIHPSLLPAFKGMNAIQKAYTYGVKYTGITIHYIDENIDEGTIIEQKVIKINYKENLEYLENKIHEIEHETYTKVIEKILKTM